MPASVQWRAPATAEFFFLPILNRGEKGELLVILFLYAARGIWVMKLSHKSSNEKKINQKGK
jgi:hypothetical protein